LSKSAENGFGAASRAVLGDGRTSGCPNEISIVAHGGWDVCDGAHRSFVMKKVSDEIAEVGMLARPAMIEDATTGAKAHEDYPHSSAIGKSLSM
jgi:hypothetical protein